MIAVGAFLTGSSGRAAVALPCTLWGEKTGSITNLEGRVQRVGRKVAPEGTAMDDWRIAVELALRLGADFDFATVDEVTDELARVAPALAGVDSTLLKSARDGVVLPLSEHTDELVLRTRGLSILAEDGSGTSWDPIRAEAVAATELEGLTADGAGEPAAADADAEAAPEPEPAACAPALWGWDGTVEDVEVPGARRVQSAPRGRSAALRQRTHGERIRGAHARAPALPAAGSARTTRPASVSSPAREVRVTSGRAFASSRSRSTPACRRASPSSTSRPTARARPS